MDTYLLRPACFADIDEANWRDWKWQNQNVVRDWSGLLRFFPGLQAEEQEKLTRWAGRGFRLLITPYVAALIGKDASGRPLENDPVWRQVFPVFETGENGGKVGTTKSDEYSPDEENWEDPAERISPIAMHKYDNRALVISCDACLGYCVFCFRSLQSQAEGEKHGGPAYWAETVRAIAERPQIEEVILSGGDPLVFDNERLGEMLADLRAIPHVRAIRIHTRAWFYNPFRFDDDLCRLLREFRVTELGVHTVHAVEITGEFAEAARRVRELGGVGLLMCDTPLIKGINDRPEILRELFMKLYLTGVKPYYLSHNMPNIPGAAAQRTSVLAGLRLWKTLKRHISNPAMPEYVICHRDGKKTVPECEAGDAEFIYGRGTGGRNVEGGPVVRFRNWKGAWGEYMDGEDSV